MSSIDLAFVGAGKAVGLELWRIEDLKPVKQTSKVRSNAFD
jgi:hypothetical protein